MRFCLLTTVLAVDTAFYDLIRYLKCFTSTYKSYRLACLYLLKLSSQVTSVFQDKMSTAGFEKQLPSSKEESIAVEAGPEPTDVSPNSKEEDDHNAELLQEHGVSSCR